MTYVYVPLQNFMWGICNKIYTGMAWDRDRMGFHTGESQKFCHFQFAPAWSKCSVLAAAPITVPGKKMCRGQELILRPYTPGCASLTNRVACVLMSILHPRHYLIDANYD